MVMSGHPRILQKLTIQEDNFKYLGVSLNSRNDMHQEIRLSLNAENQGYYNI